MAEKSETSSQDFTIERTYDAPVASVWRAITDREAIKAWFFDFEGFRPEVGSEFQFSAADNEGKIFLHLCEVKEVIPEEKLSYSWRYDGYEGDTLVTMELFAEGDRTKVKLTHAGLQNLAKIPSFAPENFAEGWTALIGTMLKDYVEKN